MTVPVVFSFATWTGMYPEFANCTSGQGQNWFNRACLYFDNSACNPAAGITVGSTTVLESLLYLLTSHVASMNAPRDPQGNPAATGAPAPPLVGRINSASEGSVSVGVEWSGSGSPSEAWYVQTRYGADFWQATAQFRTFQYGANPTVVAGPIYPGYPYRRF